MQRKKLGCFTFSGLLSALMTMIVIAGVVYARGGLLYNPGPLNAQKGELLGGVFSHAEIGGRCESCHSAPWNSTTMADLCINCHGEIAQQMRGMISLHGEIYLDNPKLECRNCHPEHRGADAPLTAMQEGEFPHELLGYSLNGHQLTTQNESFTCHDCHGEDIATFTPDSCDECHRQIDPVFAPAHVAAFGLACLDCHDGVDSLGARFNHNGFPFRLTGKHLEVTCVQCHNNARNLADFAAVSQECYSCHNQDDEHGGRFGKDCAACHSPEGWEPANFDHNRSDFKLEGKHAEVACDSCHQKNVYQDTPTDCYTCHRQDDEHGGRFGTDCVACHSPFDWEDVTFDHDQSDFPLMGAHITVLCEECHINGQFAGLSTACVSCHIDPAFHVGAFSTSCNDCHSMNVWVPARFTLSHPEPRVEEEGTGVNHGYTSCRTCHPSTVRSYTCLACHSNNQGGETGEGSEREGDDD